MEKNVDVEKVLEELNYAGDISDQKECLCFVVIRLVSFMERCRKLEKILIERNILLPDLSLEQTKKLKKVLRKKLVGTYGGLVNLRVRLIFIREKVKTVRDLIQKKEEELMGYRNFGKKSLAEVNFLLERLGQESGVKLSLGMDLSSLYKVKI